VPRFNYHNTDFWRQKNSNKRNKDWRQIWRESPAKTGAKHREANKNRQQAQHKLAPKLLEHFRVLKMKNRKNEFERKN
jgi:hypothetical protein